MFNTPSNGFMTRLAAARYLDPYELEKKMPNKRLIYY